MALHPLTLPADVDAKLPNFQRLFPLRIGQTIVQTFEADLAILRDEEEHIDYLETQLGLVSSLGEPLYLAQLVEQPDD